MCEHLVEMFISTVRTRVFGVTKPVRKSVQWSRGRNGLVRLPTIHDIHEMGFDPALGDVTMTLKICKPFRMFDEFVHEVFDCELDITQDTARVTVMPYTGQKRGEYPIHLEQLEIEVTDAGMAKIAIACLECHQFPSAINCSMRSRPAFGSRSIR